MTLSLAWWLQLRSYRHLNAAKFLVINDIEDQLPVRIFTDEWAVLRGAGAAPDPAVRRTQLVGKDRSPRVRAGSCGAGGWHTGGVTYLDPLADLIRSCLPPAARPPEDADDLFRLYAVLLRAKGERVTEEDVHDAWSAWMQTTDAGHASLVPFEELHPRRVRRTHRTRRRYGRRRGGRARRRVTRPRHGARGAGQPPGDR
ncbi:hypothetical protein ACFQV4_22940 [Streptomyces thermocarboxydus]